MATTKEGEVKAKVKEILTRLDVWHFFPAANGYGRSAIPDIICCVQGKFLAIECKKEDLQPTAIQHREMLRIIKSGGSAICINAENVGKFEEHMRKIIRGDYEPTEE
jgi:hypothetical protein